MSWILWWLWPLGPLGEAWPQIAPNIVASILCGGVLWFWKIRPHIRRLHARHDEHADEIRKLRDRKDDTL